MSDDVGEILSGLWRFEAVHPEWTEDEGGEDGWDPTVSWLVTASGDGLVLIDPLAAESQALDELVEAHGGCATASSEPVTGISAASRRPRNDMARTCGRS